MFKKFYFEHDNRTENPRTMGRNRRNNRNGPHGFAPGVNRMTRFADQDGDVDMSAPGSSWGGERRFNPYKPPKHSTKRRKDKFRGPGKPFPKNRQDAFEGDWHKISIPHGRKLGKQFILKNLLSSCKEPFVPFNFQFDGTGAMFFVNDHKAARNIKDVDRRIVTPEGFKMGVFIARSSAPVSVVMDAEAEERIKACMSNRYDISSHALNLKKFHQNPELQAVGLHVPLYKPNVASTVVKIIKEHIPEIALLDLSDNRLHTLEAFAPLVSACKGLTTLNLENNKLKLEAELNHIKGWNNIVCLKLGGNPLCDNFKEKTSYISVIRERLPNVMNLDNVDLPAPIRFDLGAETVPSTKGSFFIAEDVKALVVQFLEQYYTIYDSTDREKLLDAYHEQANFSLCAVRSQSSQRSNMQQYITESRNLLRITDPTYRMKLLKHGRLAVVSTISQLPQTLHDPHSFSVDIFHVSPGLMAFSVTGVFKEVVDDTNNQPLRTFHRTFLVAAQGQGFVIMNEMLHIAAATSEQVKAFKFPAPTPSPSPAPSMGDKSPSEKQQMAIEFTKATSMNLDFSAKCLEENEWDFQKALMVFSELNSLGRIPPEAFLAKQ